MQQFQSIFDKVMNLRATSADRDSADADIHAVRDGRIGDVFPQMFNDDFPKPVISNFVDVAARDLAESLAPLPSFNAASTNMVSDSARNRADKKTKGMSYYLTHSRLQEQMYTGGDYYVTYGRMPVIVEPDFETHCPRFVIIDPRNSYPEIDRFGKTRSYTKIYRQTIAELCAQYPEHALQIAGPYDNISSNNQTEVALYMDHEYVLMFLPERRNHVIDAATNSLGVCTVSVAERPGVIRGRGQFADVLWTQVARNRFAALAMQAAEMATEAPLAVPYDVQEVALGPLALLRSQSPEKIRRIEVGMPQAAFAEGQLLDQELKVGARYPGTRTGNLDASIITGQGVRALESGYDSQIVAAHDVFATTFRDAMGIALRMDEHYWPDEERSIVGNQEGVPYEIKWLPSRDIKGDYSVDVTYGFSVGDPNRSLVFILQMLGAGLLSKDLARRQFPFQINVTQEETRIEVENLRDSLVQSIAGYAQTIPLMAQQGADPSEAVARLAQIIKNRQKGKALEEVIADAFAPPEPPPGQQPGAPGAPQDPLAALMGGGGGGMPGMPPGVAPGQAQMGPGGQPDLMTMLAGLNSGGGPTSTVNVKRAIPA